MISFPFTINQIGKYNIYRYEQRFFSHLYTILVDHVVEDGNPLIYNKLYLLTGQTGNDINLKVMELTKDWNCHKTKDIVICDRNLINSPKAGFYIIRQKDRDSLLHLPIQFRYVYKILWNRDTANVPELQQVRTTEWFTENDWELTEKLYYESLLWASYKVEYKT